MQDTHRASRNEFEVLIVLMCFLVGISQTFFAETPSGLENLPQWAQNGWSWSLFGSGTVIFIGIIMWWNDFWALLLELSGMMTLAGATLAYTAAVFIDEDTVATGLVAVPITFAFSIAALIRVWKIFRKIILRKDRQARLEEEVRRQLAERVLGNAKIETKGVLPPEGD